MGNIEDKQNAHRQIAPAVSTPPHSHTIMAEGERSVGQTENKKERVNRKQKKSRSKSQGREERIDD